MLATAAAVVAVDQVTKSLAVHYLRSGPAHVVGTLDLQLTFNSGVAFSIGRGYVAEVVVLGVAVLAALLVLGRRVPSPATAVAVGLVAGGAASNLADRLFRSNGGAVIDFIDLHFWPTFNVADACIVVGAVWLVILVLLRRQHP